MALPDFSYFNDEPTTSENLPKQGAVITANENPFLHPQIATINNLNASGEGEPLHKRIRDFDRTFTIRVTNGAFPATIQLFGARQFLFAPAGFVVTVSECTYQELLQESLLNPFIIGGMTISTSALNLTQVAQVINRDPTGVLTQIPIHINSYFSTNQYPINYVEIFPISLNVDGDTILQFTLLPNTNMTLTLYVKERIRPQNLVTDEPILEIGDETWLNRIFEGQEVTIAPATVKALTEQNPPS